MCVDIAKEVDEFLAKADGDPRLIRVLIRFLVTLRVTSDEAEDRSLLEHLDKKFKQRNELETDEGLWIFNSENREDAIFALGHIIARLGAQAATPHLEDIVPCLIWSLSDDISIYIQLCACKALHKIEGIVGDKLLDYFEPLFDGLLGVYKKPMHAEPDMSVNFRCLNHKLMLFKRHVDTQCPRTLRFLLKWISHLCNAEMLRLLPDFLEDMFNDI